MSNQYIAEIRIFGFNFAPLDWAQCNGQTVAVDQNSTLFQIIGSTFGGNGTTTFNLPNLQDLTAAGIGTGLGLRNWPLGATFGEANHTLLISEVPLHTHSATFGGGVVVVVALGDTSSIGDSLVDPPRWFTAGEEIFMKLQ